MGRETNPLYCRAYAQIRENILAGIYKPGERLSDMKLSTELGISHTPVREAVQLLIQEGLLGKVPNKGVTVFNPSIEDTANIYVMRAGLEGVASGFAASLKPGEEKLNFLLFQLSEELSKSESAYKTGDAKQLAESNIKFHDYIIQTNGSKHFQDYIESLRAKTLLLRYGSLMIESRARVSIEEHLQIYEMIKAGRSVEVEKFTRHHILAAGYRILENLRFRREPEFNHL